MKMVDEKCLASADGGEIYAGFQEKTHTFSSVGFFAID
jgi:hypothetical protein